MMRIPRPDPAAGDAARLGEELREARLVLGLSIDDVAAALRIRGPYLVALEQGRVRDLPAPAYAIAFVRSYATALGLDADDMVRRFRTVTGGMPRTKADLIFPEPVPERGVPAGALVLTGVVLALGAYVGWYNWSGTGNRTVDVVPPPPTRIEELARESAPPAPVVGQAAQSQLPAGASQAQNATAVPLPLALPGPQPSTPTAAAAATSPVMPLPPPAPPPAAALAAEESHVVLRARSMESWVQVREGTAGPILFSRVLRPGESFAVPPRAGLTFSTGNAGALDVLVDGEALPPLPPGSQQVRRDVSLEPERLKADGLVPVTRPSAQRPPAAPAPAMPAR